MFSKCYCGLRQVHYSVGGRQWFSVCQHLISCGNFEIQSSSIRLPRYAGIQMKYWTCCRQDLSHNDTMVLQEGRWAAVRVGVEVAERQKSGRYDRF